MQVRVLLAHSRELQSLEIRSLTLKSSAEGIHPEFECRAQKRVHVETAPSYHYASRPLRYRRAAFKENVVEYKHMRLCHGMKKEFAPCEFIDKCDLCINSWFDYDNDNEHYIIMMGALDLKCKRDNPNFKPLTRHEFFEIYKKMKDRTNISITELLESAVIMGAVKDDR